MTEKAPKIHIETPLKNYAFTEHTISKEKKRKRKRRRRNYLFAVELYEKSTTFV